jgi:hypothetical protein
MTDKDTNTDTDGMPLAPSKVLTSPLGAYIVFGPAMNQATSWHAPTQQEKDLTTKLLNNWKLSTLNGPTKETTSEILSAAEDLGLQVRRVKTTKKVDGVVVPDSYLLVYTKPGIKNYSGAFFMLRETKHSKVFIISPHDDSDGTYADTKIGMSDSYALACISNGHKRGRVGLTGDKYRNSDIVHSTDNLGTFALELICEMFPKLVCLHIHGMSDTSKCLFRCRNDEMGNVFKTVIADKTRLDPEDFKPLNAFFTIDSLVNTNYYLKTEIPAAIHESNFAIIKNIAVAMEKYPWCF